MCGGVAASRWGGGWPGGGVGEDVTSCGLALSVTVIFTRRFLLFASEGPYGFTQLTSMRTKAVREWGVGSGSRRCRGSIEARRGNGGDTTYGRGMHQP